MMVREILAGVLRGVVSQRLLPRKDKGRVAAVEVLVNTARIADLIRDPEKTHGITEAIEDGAYHHMQSFSQHLVQLVVDEIVELDVAAAAATNRHDFEIAVEQALRRKRAADEGKSVAVDFSSLADDEAEPEPEPEPMPGLRLAATEQ
jgi:Tfp pilus assembly ATPase PilU